MITYKCNFPVWIVCLLFVLNGCAEKDSEVSDTENTAEQTYHWKLVTSWPKNFPGVGRAPETFAKYVERMSNGRLKISVYGADDLVPAFEVFDTVSRGTAQVGHSTPYYWKGKSSATQIFAAIPFGMNAQEVNAWLHYGGGIELWRELYAPFGLLPFAGGNTGPQFAGWFNKEINTIEDFKGLKIRMPGLGGEILKKFGVIPVVLPAGELFISLQSGVIDATEWIGPYNDLALGLHKAANYYYYSPWHEPGHTSELIVNKEAFEQLPSELQAIIEIAARAVNQDMLDEYTARNNHAMQILLNEHRVNIRALPDDVIKALRLATTEVMREQAEADPMFKKVYTSYQTFQQQVSAYHEISEQAYYTNRNN